MQEKYKIRKMKPDELHLLTDWAKDEGWNPGIYDVECFNRIDPKGFFIGLLDSKPISCMTAVSYDNKFGFLGFYIVRPEFRGKGYGIKIWNHALKHLRNHNIGLDGVLDQVENYKKFGFKLAHRNIRYQTLSNKFGKISKTINLTELPIDTISEYEKDLFPVPRIKFLQDWIRQPRSHTVGFIQGGKLKGYGAIRQCSEGYKIGPLFADNSSIAKTLFESLNNLIPKGSIFTLDIPEPNKQALKLVQEYNMKKVFETARMYLEHEPKMDLKRIYGITSFEVG